MIGLTCLLLLVASALVADLLTTADPATQEWRERLLPPGGEHLMGTDEFGRDVFARVLFGGRVSLAAGAVPVLIGGICGTLLGLISGFLGGRWDQLLMRLMDVILAFPTLFLALAIVGALGTGLINAMLAVAVISVPGYARITRGQVLTIREREYVVAARASGAGGGWIMAHHLLPNVMAPLLVQSTLSVGYAILATASLSFLGLGTQPPTADWGMMLATARQYLPEAWWLALFPGAMIMLSVLSVNLVGEGLRDVVGK
jgi:peptide/nickel transport system permease protein